MIENKFIQILIGFVSIGWSSVAHSGEVPKELFNIPLGSIVNLSYQHGQSVDNIPKKKFVGTKTSTGNGIQYYFQPLVDDKKFPYVEKSQGEQGEPIITSFKLYLLPVIAIDTDRNTKMENTQSRWEVLSIDWFDDIASENEAYRWAKDLCQTYTKDISVVAEITDYPDANWYECRYASSKRVLNIGGMSARTHISLSFEPDVITEKEAAIKNAFPSLQPKPFTPRQD